MLGKNRNKLIRELIKSTDEQLDDEQLMHVLIDQKIVDNINTDEDDRTYGQRAADVSAKFAGSWAFIISFWVVMFIWILTNIWISTARPFDPYPFILLNLVLSCIAAIQAPLILMSQNRQEAKDRIRSDNDYRVNLKTEIVISDLHKKLDRLVENQKKLISLYEKQHKHEEEI
ncbi:MAG: DUF1003 domain-containing protein [Synergistaceae bacterium]|nr:DUF1003 domain-containing protein [Synergistaceae bacterium]